MHQIHGEDIRIKTKNYVQSRNDKKLIGNYLIGQTIGQGTFGKVKIGVHLLTEEKVAVKILQKEKIVDKGDYQRVSRELFILKKIHHPNLIQLFEIIETQNNIYLITEYASQGELFKYIQSKKKLDEQEACRFFKQIIFGVEYLHKLKIVHRDLKPENLLLDSNFSIKIVDFGLSNIYQSDSLLKTACGSPCYAAPEMIAGQKYQGSAVDIWSCGIILFAMVCGYLPFEDPDTASLYKKIIKGEFTLPSYLSQQLQELINGVLNVNPQRRLTINQIKKSEWLIQRNQESEPKGIIVDMENIPINSCILEQLPKYGIDMKDAKRSISLNKHNLETSTYYLLHQKMLSETKCSKVIQLQNQSENRLTRKKP